MTKHYSFILFLLANFFGLSHATNLFPSPLISAEWLVDNIENVTLLDVRKELKSFISEGHIESANLVDVNKVRIKRIVDGKNLTRMRHDADSFQSLMRSHGINNDSQVVITHRGLTPGQVAGATRLYWQMKSFNFKNIALLDGGNAAWVEALEDLTEETSSLTVGNYTSGTEDTTIVATMQQVQTKLKDKATTLIDTRSLRQHIGIDKKDYVYAFGHIPGSRNLPYKFLHPSRGHATFVSTDKLKSIINSLRIEMNKDLILYCNSAFECSSDWFVLHELLGHTEVRIYDGSLHQWTQYDNNPVTTSITH